MTDKTKARKPRRKLSEIDFSGEGAHIALTSKTVNGGPANGADYALVIKAKTFSPEFLAKAQQVQVTLELPDFLRKFFGLYYEDAEILARMMGYVPPEKDDSVEYSYEDYIEERLEAFQIIKSLHEAESIATVLSEISEDQYLAILHDQEKLEKAFLDIEKARTESKDAALAATEDNTSQICAEVEKENEVDTSVVNKAHKENLMTTENNTVEPQIEMVEKSALDVVQKALDDQKAELLKAQELIAQFQAEKQEAIVKAKSAQIKEVVDAKHFDVICKAALAIEADADFDSFVSALREIKELVEKSALFEEQGTSGESEEAVKESGVAKILKAQLQSK